MFFVHTDQNDVKSSPKKDIKIKPKENYAELVPIEDEKPELVLSKFHLDENENSTEVEFEGKIVEFASWFPCRICILIKFLSERWRCYC